MAAALTECGEKQIPGAVLIPSGFAETGNEEGQHEIQEIGRKYNIRLMGPNIYGFYYTPKNLCATFCTAYDVRGHAALSSQSGGIGMTGMPRVNSSMSRRLRARMTPDCLSTSS